MFRFLWPHPWSRAASSSPTSRQPDEAITTRPPPFRLPQHPLGNGTLAGLSIAACGLLAPDTPYPLLIGILIVAGMTRSMQFTALATLAFADIDTAHRSSASTLSSMFQQITSVFGIALCIGLLGLAQLFHPAAPLGLADFRFAFLAMGAITVAASLQLLTLHREAGAEVSGHKPT